MISWIAFDADDTLWENEIYYQNAQKKMQEILAGYCSPETTNETLLQTETRNIPYFGYGIKSFGLSMIETAVQISNGEISAREIQIILESLKEMISTPVKLLPGVIKTIKILSKDYHLMVITKGDLLDQERKFKNSQLSPFVEVFEVVNAKEKSTYQGILDRWHILPKQFVMAGNSLRSDVLPVAAIGGIGVLISHYLTWDHEKSVNSDLQNFPYYEIDKIKKLPGLIDKINQSEQN
ncbi:MAG: haloacid dehalogenase [Chloroflexi bacterium HGW-Chloroflexi-8]|nr:MAG: haloacid dehalogenase [Chloroflexi bacterium HGW-Chloroflexi-8]